MLKGFLGLFVGLGLGAYLPAAILVAQREQAYAAAGVVPNMHPGIILVFALGLAAMFFIGALVVEAGRLMFLSEEPLRFTGGILLGLCYASVPLWFLLFPSMIGRNASKIELLAILVAHLCIFYALRVVIQKRHNKALEPTA